jgi:RND superfamily putative drug exporter
LAATRPTREGSGSGGAGSSRRGPWAVGGVALAILLALCVPYLDMRLGSSDAGNGPEELHTRRAYDLLAEGFGPGFNGPLLITVEGEGAIAPGALDGLGAAMAAVPGVAAVSPAVTNEAGDTAVITVIPSSSPQDEATSGLVERLRDEVLPGAEATAGVQAYVGGSTAAFVDIGDKISARMPLFFAVVIGLSVLLLAAVFRSVIVPIKAALLNLLSVGAAFGVVTAVFQWGWLGGLLGVDRTGPIESFLPMMLFGILFGLSMD